jgi:hypothetical protein
MNNSTTPLSDLSDDDSITLLLDLSDDDSITLDFGNPTPPLILATAPPNPGAQQHVELLLPPSQLQFAQKAPSSSNPNDNDNSD